MNSDAGFSLLEALIALSIMGIILSGALQVLAPQVQVEARATAKLRAVLAAETILTRVGLDVPLAATMRSGQLADGAKWHLIVTEYKENGLHNLSENEGLYKVEVKVAPNRWPAETVILKTLRIKGGRL